MIRRCKSKATASAMGIAGGAIIAIAVLAALPATNQTEGRGLASVHEVLARQGAAEGGEALYTPTALSDMLPNVEYRYGATSIYESSAVARGRIVGWAPGRAFGFAAVDTSSGFGEDKPWASSEALVHLINLKFEVSQVLATSDRAPVLDRVTPVAVELRIDGQVDADAFAADLLHLGDVVLFLNYDGSSTGPTSWSIAENGALIAQVSEDGALSLPAASVTASGKASIGRTRIDLPSVAALRLAARAERTIRVG